MVVEGDVRLSGPRAQAREGRQVQGGRLVAFESQPGLGAFTRGRRNVLRHRQGFERPLVGLLIRRRPGVGQHVVRRRVELRDARVVAQGGEQLSLDVGRQHDDRRFVFVQIVEKEFAQPLAVQRRAGGAALVQFVNHAPDRPTGISTGGRCVAIGKAEVRIAQTIAAQILADTGQDHDAGTAVGQVLRGVLGQAHRAFDRVRAGWPVFARSAGLCGAARRSPQGATQSGAHDGVHRVMRSLYSNAAPSWLGMNASA